MGDALSYVGRSPIICTLQKQATDNAEYRGVNMPEASHSGVLRILR